MVRIGGAKHEFERHRALTRRPDRQHWILSPCRHSTERKPMFLIREVMYCKPGKVRPMVEKFKAMSKLSEKVGMPRMRVMTDFCAEQYWTIVSEMEVPSLQEFEQMMSSMQGSAEDMKQFEELMKGYHDLVDHGKREIYKIEG